MQTWKSVHICPFANKIPYNSWTKFGQKLEIWTKFRMKSVNGDFGWTKNDILETYFLSLQIQHLQSAT